MKFIGRKYIEPKYFIYSTQRYIIIPSNENTIINTFIKYNIHKVTLYNDNLDIH